MREFHNTTEDMVKCFVHYMPCDKQVQREALACGRPVDLRTVAAIRARYERMNAMPAPEQDNTVVWMDQRYAKDMVEASQWLALAIMRARAA